MMTTSCGNKEATAAAHAAAQAAACAASNSGVQIQELREMAELEQVCALVDEIWRSCPGHSPVTAEILRALAHSGNYVAGAFAGRELVGACAAFFASPADRAMHSHIAGASPRVTGRHVGFALKLHQRAWALARGITEITWTFDPLVARNAYFNIAKLAARATTYLPNFYGAMDDGINAGDDTDRLLVRWRLDAPLVTRACAGAPSHIDAAALRAAGAAVLLDAGPSGLPIFGGAGATDPAMTLVRVPSGIEDLRTADVPAARTWRRAVRQALGGLLADGGQVTGFDKSGWYVVARHPGGHSNEDHRG